MDTEKTIFYFNCFRKATIYVTAFIYWALQFLHKNV